MPEYTISYHEMILITLGTHCGCKQSVNEIERGSEVGQVVLFLLHFTTIFGYYSHIQWGRT